MTFRTDSLARKLQEFKVDGSVPVPSKLDELMIFLECPPPGTRDRFKAGAALVNGWGIKCGRSSVWSLYHSYALLWRMGVANAATQSTEDISSLEEKIRHKAVQRLYETLANPELEPFDLIKFAKLADTKEAREFNREKFKEQLRKKVETGLNAIYEEIKNIPAALEAFNALQAALGPRKK